MGRPCESPSSLFLLSALVACGGCAVVPLWRTAPEARVPDSAVAAAIGDSYRGPTHVFDPAAIPKPPEPTHLRPCCAFGADLKVEVGVVPVPGFVIDNMRGLEDIGPHRYDIGVFEASSSADPGAIARENNGLLYTCRGGFIDLAHVRLWADTTVYLTAQIQREMDLGGVIELADQGGKRHIVIEAIDAERIADVGRRELAVALAQWLVFQASVWHEIASWYGYAAVGAWPEKISAFSPEDLYSNLLGTKLAGGIMLFGGSSDERDYNNAMNAWLTVALKRMRVATKESATAAMYAVDGRWWDSTKRIPDWHLVLRRNFETGASLNPWLVPMAFAPKPEPSVDCANAGPPLRMRNPSGVEGVRFDHDASLQIDVDDNLAANGFPFPRRNSRRISEGDFRAIIEKIRRENAAAFGEGHDRPVE